MTFIPRGPGSAPAELARCLRRFIDALQSPSTGEVHSPSADALDPPFADPRGPHEPIGRVDITLHCSRPAKRLSTMRDSVLFWTPKAL